MSKSASLRLQDCRAIYRLAGECRELGDDRDAWRSHFIERLAGLVDADLGFCGEQAGCLASGARDLGVTEWGWEHGFNRAPVADLQAAFEHDPHCSKVITAYFGRLAREDGACCTRRQITADREWYRSADYELVARPSGSDHMMVCFRSIAGDGPGEFSGLFLHRAADRRDFTVRDCTLVREAHAAIAPLVGGPLARFADPSPRDLAPRVQDVLACLLEGDGDKRVAVRLRLSIYTVNQYTKVIFRHFGVRSRPELLARWIRRGWGGRLNPHPGPSPG
jgi:DNA-binding CsgD family transcriptional regulator